MTETFPASPCMPPMRPLFTLVDGLELILASASPRRRQFLTEWGVPFRLVCAATEEPRPDQGELPEAYTRRAAVAKALAVAKSSGMTASRSQAGSAVQRVILSADTVVAVDDDILGKPETPEHAMRMLERLNGRGHEVTSAVCLLLPETLETPCSPGSTQGMPLALPYAAPLPQVEETCNGGYRQLVFSDTSRVFFHHWPRSVLEAYARTGEPDDKAGAYAIQGQGAVLVERVEGSWSTVVGLPVTLLAHMLLYQGIMLPASVPR